jgi:type IV secretory pathway TrbF-like protein
MMLNPRTSLLVCLTIMEKRSNVLNQFQRVPKVFEKMVNEIVGVELETVLKTSWITAVTNK